MQTEARFENISVHICQEISKAQKSIYIVVVKFNNKDIFNELLIRAKSDCKVFMIIAEDRVDKNPQIDIEQLNVNKSRAFKIRDEERVLANSSFCIIDHSTVITGSFTWGRNEETSHQNVIISHNNKALANQFISEFNRLCEKYCIGKKESELLLPINELTKRLEILKNYILLEDFEAFNKEADKLSQYDSFLEISDIVDDVNSKQYSAAITKIHDFLSQNQQLLIWSDPEIAALKLEIKNLENELNAIDNEKIELEKVLYEFQYRHTIELGHIILEILKLKKIKYRDDKEKYQEADNDEKQYQEHFNAETEKNIIELSPEDRDELKKKFRRASFLCHPDKVDDDLKEQAQNIFADLTDAYNKNDLKKVTEILEGLEKGGLFRIKSDTITEKEALFKTIENLRAQIKVLINEIISIKESETYKTIISIDNWNDYFTKTKDKLNRELEKLRLEIRK